MKDLLNKNVTVHLGVFFGFTDTIRGKVIDIANGWLKIETKKSIEHVNLQAIKRVTEMKSQRYL